MKAILSLLACALFCHYASAQVFTSQIVIEDIYWKNHNEWLATFHAELYEDGVVQPPSPNNYYAWWKRLDGQGEFAFDIQRSGFGGCDTCVTGWHTQIDHHGNVFYEFYVDIVLPGNEHVVSPVVRIGKWGDPEEAVLWARRENGTLLDGYEADSIGLWSGYRWHWNYPSMTGDRRHVMSTGDVIKVKPNTEELGEKFHRGLTNRNDVTYLNYDGYPIYPSPERNELTFHHRSIYNATIHSHLVDAPAVILRVKFKDPWLEDTPGFGGEYYSRGMSAEYRSHDSPWTISTTSEYRGVFLNQDYNIPGNPYYSVGAPSVQQLGNFTAYFLTWVGNSNEVTYRTPTKDTTAVVFKVSNATAVAQYKAHLASSLATATASNSQRLVAVAAEDWYHMVYPSAGELFLTVSSDGGLNWGADQQISNTGGLAGAPSVALVLDRTWKIYTVYRRQVGDQWAIMFCDADNPFATTVQLNNPAVPLPLTIDVRPVLIRTYSPTFGDELFVLWQGFNGLRANRASVSGGDLFWAGEGEGIVGDYRNPSVSVPNLRLAEDEGCLTFDDNKHIYVLLGLYTDAQVVPASLAPTSYASQVSADNGAGQVHVVWEAYGDEHATNRGGTWRGDAAPAQRYVMYQQYNGSWSSAHVFRSMYGSVHFYRPTVTNLSNGTIVWAWDDGASSYEAVNEGSGWVLTRVYDGTVRPNLAIGSSQGPASSTRFVSTSLNGPPYRLNVGEQSSRALQTPRMSVLPEQYTRQVVVANMPRRTVRGLRRSSVAELPLAPSGSDSSSFISVEMLSIAIKMRDGSVVPVELAPAADSVYDERSVWRTLSTVPVTVGADADSIVVQCATEAVTPLNLSGDEVGLGFEVVDAERGTMLKKIGTERVFRTSGRGNLERRETITDVSGRRVVVRAAVRGLLARTRKLAATVVHIHTLLTDSLSQQRSLAAHPAQLREPSGGSAALPHSFAVHPNYPNPFNPATSIRYDLPEASHVSLVVYDVLGREVVELVNGMQDAGFKSVEWNAAGVASGVYLARFTAMDGNGSVKLAKLMKLVLAK